VTAVADGAKQTDTPDGTVDEDPYLWPGTSCLRNLLGIRDPDQLSNAEHELVGIRTAEILASPLPGSYDTAHLRLFHRTLFQDVYDWAGELRVGNIEKGDAKFVSADLVPARLDQMFDRLAQRGHLTTLDWDDYVIAFAGLYGELNAIHPFREGNGRTQRAFLRQLAGHAGWGIAWQSLQRRANDQACSKYLRTGRPQALIRLLAPAISARHQ
jgi:cell filamentation protein